jgi:tRNA-modifying protein YgfZ
MRLYPLQKKVFLFKPQAKNFLNGITSNDLKASQNAFLNAQGKIVVTTEQCRRSDDEILMVIEASFAQRLAQHLKKYLFLGETKIEEPAYLSYFDLDGTIKIEKGNEEIPQKKGRIILTTQSLKTDVKDDEFLRFRLENRIPMQGMDYDQEMLLNLDCPGYVSFEKGCFLGQEILARVHHRGKPPRKLVVKTLSNGDNLASQLTSKVVDLKSKKVSGFLWVPNT